VLTWLVRFKGKTLRLKRSLNVANKKGEFTLNSPSNLMFNILKYSVFKIQKNQNLNN
tara:strand:- start:2405 stop:2575 length:171 start_codon:yes stop_codon:yes gene_type:complete